MPTQPPPPGHFEEPSSAESGQSSGPGPAASSTAASSTATPLREAISRAWSCGADDARRTARETLPRARQAVAEFATDLAYGLGYGATFAAALLESMGAKDAGWSSERGMQAGRHAAAELIRRFGRRNPKTPPPVQPDGEGKKPAA